MLGFNVMTLVFMFDVFFCFKQKTAYDLRISDWSSDVCSSDLDGTPAWLVTRYNDVRSILADPRVSSNQNLPGFPQIELLPRPSEEESTFLNMDAPRHTLFRRLISKHFIVKKRSEEHTSELQSLMRITYAVFCLKKKTHNKYTTTYQ